MVYANIAGTDDDNNNNGEDIVMMMMTMMTINNLSDYCEILVPSSCCLSSNSW